MTSSVVNNITKASQFIFMLFLFFLPLLGEEFRVTNLFHVSFGLLLLSFLINKPFRQQLVNDHALLKGIAAMGLFLCYFSLSNLWSDNPGNIISTLKHSFYIIAFSVLFLQLNKKVSYSILFFSITLLCILTLWEVDKRHFLTMRLDNGFFAAPDNVIDLAGYFGLGIFFGLLLIRETGRHIFYIPIAVLFIAMLLTQSRGPVLSLVVASLPLMFRFHKGHMRHLMMAATILILVAFLAYFTHYSDELISRFIASYQQSFIRFGIWSHTVEVALQKPWFGWGFDKNLAFVNSVGQNIHTTHSLYFSTLLKGGFTGLFIFFVMIAYGLYRAWQHFKNHQELEASIFCFSLMFYLTQGMFIIGNPDIYWVMFWLPYAIILTPYGQRSK
ncbi:hypothetical protein B1H58_08095 [Pantoea alhagi]|uniref:O-antigen ligase-related domain-containing protein n=1 Tax=Pantoea alhagi TaxID=1891675 RepID=A0A1W6B4H3_9GAMM|nr:O-antigen ligase family protein [Pantoea alhagi]ARJ41991.1 hypothetical protein B1H58_08095 [Pantoea alhagi]